MVPFSFSGEEMCLAEARALFWPREQALLVADLHLEKASFYAERGQMLPPYDSRETLERLARAIRVTGARRVFALGDNFHDADGDRRLEPHAAGMLAALTHVLEWVWISGNHDYAPSSLAGGECLAELAISGLVLRHMASPDETRAEVSGHFHPRFTFSNKGRRVNRPCAVVSATRLVLPAFGSLTGGLDASDPAILAAMQPSTAIDALVAAGGKVLQFPLFRSDEAMRWNQDWQPDLFD